MKYYLKTQNPCNLYTVTIERVPCKRKLDDSKYVTFDESQIDTFNKLVLELQNCMQNFWQQGGFDKNRNFDRNKKYSYVTTSYSSHLKRLKVIRNLIKKKEDTLTCQYNYFEEESDAEELCKHMEDILKRYGIL